MAGAGDQNAHERCNTVYVLYIYVYSISTLWCWGSCKKEFWNFLQAFLHGNAE
jgi:hypothetical protein